MSTDRRNDIGMKIGGVIVGCVVTYMMALLFSQSHGDAMSALARAEAVEKKQAVCDVVIAGVVDDVKEIKSDVKTLLKTTSTSQIKGR